MMRGQGGRIERWEGESRGVAKMFRCRTSRPLAPFRNGSPPEGGRAAVQGGPTFVVLAVAWERFGYLTGSFTPPSNLPVDAPTTATPAARPLASNSFSVHAKQLLPIDHSSCSVESCPQTAEMFYYDTQVILAPLRRLPGV